MKITEEQLEEQKYKVGAKHFYLWNRFQDVFHLKPGLAFRAEKV